MNNLIPSDGKYFNGTTDDVCEKPADVFDHLRACRERFHKSCENLKRASADRASAERELQKVSAEANQAINMALLDPTEPQPTQVAKSANGRY